MNEQETKELFDILIIETKRQRGIKVTKKEDDLVWPYGEENRKLYGLIVDYVETWIRLDEENIEE